MSVMTVDDPNAEMQRFHEGVGASATSEATAAPAEAPAPAPEAPLEPQRTWRDEIIDDPDLPPSLRGKPVGEYVNSTKRALADMNHANMLKNEAAARAEVAEASLRLAIQQLSQQQQAPAPQQQRAHELFGLRDPNEIYNEGVLPTVMDQIPRYVQEQVNQAVKQVRDEEIAPLRQRTVAEAMERAQEVARNATGIKDPETWLALRGALASFVHANGWNPELPQTWIAAVDMHKRVAPYLVPQQVSVTPGAPPAGNARPGASAAVAAKRPTTTGNRTIDAEVQRQVAIWKSQGVNVSAEDIMKSMRQERAAGFGDDE